MLRRLIAKYLSWLLSSLRLDPIIDSVNRSVGGCIIAYHHVSATTLEEQLELLSRRYAIVSLSEFVSRHAQDKSTAGLMVITFDDGFAKEVEDGAALAIRRGWPMTFYLPTQFVKLSQPYWFEEIGPLLKVAPEGQHRVDGLSFYLNDSKSRARARDQIVRHLFYQSTLEIQTFMKRLQETLFGSIGRPPNVQIPGPISRERVRELCRNEEVSFEAHSVCHPFFSTLSPEEIREEMQASRREVEEMTERPVRHFCYPYGDSKAIGPKAPEIARSLFQSATTIAPGRCRPSIDRAMLPRIALFEHYTAAMAALKVETTR
ncbi:hypothetical protein AMJ44_13340 [candidate division WOR-1 bacterium DG_54_3]|uniref:NodB homology domain-containing protein n=1 Tax=candidate division WOR-1 bacterium DG_54_3 TaxID=1703775 RepID=A0A0S7XNX6_UNCSA|nr:MAG: hypothetical protein AMJ44_13340 [candidate division WOR-1 bacterium DG_54_3]